MNIYYSKWFISIMVNVDESVLIARESGSQFTVELTYALLSRIFPVVLLADIFLFLVMLLIYFEGSASYFGVILLVIWILLTAAVGYLAALICTAGIEENIKRTRDAPSLFKVLLFGAFSIIWFAALLSLIWFTLFAGFS